MSSQRKHNFLMAKLKRGEAEKQEQAAMRLAKQKHEIVMRKKELEIQMEQMALQELEEGHRQRVAAAKLDEAELMDNHSLFSHHSSELNLFKDRRSDRSQVLVQDWVNLFPASNSSELNFSRPGSATADPPVKDTAPSNPPENTSNVANHLHHLEMLSQYTRPGVAICKLQCGQVLPSRKLCIGNISRLNCSNHSLIKGSSRPTVPQEVVRWTQWTKYQSTYKMSHSHHFSHLCNLTGHRHPLWHHQTPFLYLIFQQTHK